MTRRTVDALVGVKWFIPESHMEEDERLIKGSYELLGPDFFYVEVANILWKHAEAA